MKKIILSMFFLLSVMTLQAQKEIKSKLEKVTVYPFNALVEKSVKVNLVKGENKFVITDNATTFDKENLHFTQQEDFFITSVNLEYENQSFGQAAKKNFPANIYSQVMILKDKVNKIQLKIKDNNQLLTTYNQQLKALQNLKALKNTQVIDTVSILKQQFEFQREEGVKLNGLIDKTKNENKELEFNLIELKNELEDLVKNNNGNCNLTTKSNNIRVSIYSNRNMTATLYYDYLVYNVTSSYLYDVMLDESMNSAIFNLKTNVSQSTNENWKDCNIVFSTNEAGFAGQDKELDTWYLDKVQESNYFAKSNTKKAMLTNNRESSNSKEILMNDFVEEEKTANTDETTYEVSLNAELENFTLSREYALNIKQSIGSDINWQTIPLISDTTKAYFTRFSTPKIIEEVYYTALLPDWEDLGLQNVKCDIFLNGKYIANSYINTASTKDTMQFSAGEDKNVKIARKVRKSSPDKSFLSSNVEETVTVTLNIKNTKNQTVDVGIKDQIPISQNAEIKIVNVQVGEGNLNANTGIVKWKLSLAPKEVKEVKFSYTVKYPKDFKLILN